jgi:uncharacterized protein YwgA
MTKLKSRLIALKLVLDTLGIPFDPHPRDSRMIIHKAVYLAQEKAVDLGYHFGWYLKGVYCPELAKDICEIDEKIETYCIAASKNQFYKRHRDRLNELTPLLTPPDIIDMPQVDWLYEVTTKIYNKNKEGEKE